MDASKKEQFKQFILNTILEVMQEDESIKEMTATGNVAGFNTPFAFTKRKNGNPDAAKASGYTLVNNETEESDKKVISEAVVGDPFLGRKISSYLAETNRMLTVVESLMARKTNPKHAKLMKENSFAKRTVKDISDIREKFGRIAEQFNTLVGGSEISLVKEASTPTLQPRTFDIASGFTNFQADLAKIVTGYETLFNESLVGKEVTIRASKGFGQIKKDYKIVPSSVTLSLVKDEYQLVVKDKQQKDYYLDTTFKIVISGKDSQQTEKPVVPTDTKPVQPVAPAPAQKQQSTEKPITNT